MNKAVLILLLTLLTMNLSVFAKDRISPVAHTQEYYDMNSSEEYDFSNSNQYLTDEQLQDAQEIEIEDPQDNVFNVVIERKKSDITDAITQDPAEAARLLTTYIRE